jgi:hypothetical protein
MIQISELVGFLKDNKYRDHDIVDILENIIKSYMMYGGSLQESINYQMEVAKKKAYISR